MAEAGKFLWDAKRAVERVQRFTAGRSLDDYLADELLRSAVERQLEIVGEALSGLRRVAPDLFGSIPDAPRIVAFRNILIHQYAAVDDLLVWGVIQGKVPDLDKALQMLLDGLEAP